MADVLELCVGAFGFMIWLSLVYLPVYAQMKWGFWVALFVAAAEFGLLYIYAEFFGPRGYEHFGEIMVIFVSYWAIAIAFAVATGIALFRLVSKRADERG